MKDLSRAVIEYIEENYESYVDLLGELVSIPTVSAVMDKEMWEGANFVASLLRERGFNVDVKAYGGHPVVLGEVGEGDRTILIYNHYDVQPPEPLDLWVGSPFELRIEGGKLYGRGVADNKGNIIARIAALDAVLPYIDELGLKVKFLIEGEEEIGSPNLYKCLEANKDALKADGGIWETGYIGRDEKLGIPLGFKGMLYVEFIVKGPNRDVHSGRAPLIPNPIWRLIKLLSLLKKEDGTILVPGIYDDIDKDFLDMASEFLKDIDTDWLDKMRLDLGIKEFVGGVDGVEALKVLWTSPSLNISGIYGGYSGEGSKTVIPSIAGAKVDIRPVPGQDPKKILDNLKKYLEENGFGDVELRLHGMYPSGYTKPDEDIIKATVKAAERVYGHTPHLSPISAGSGPIYWFTNYLGIPMTGAGVGYYGSNTHSPNENIRVNDFVMSMKHVANLFIEFARNT